MRILLRLPLALLALATIVSAQDMESRLEEKLAKDFIKNADWEMDFDAAKAKAKESGKLIFAYFTRSYSP
jgi:hypothetical protein